MSEFDRSCDAVVRAAYQISGLTGSRVPYDQINKVVPMSAAELQQVILALQARGLVPGGTDYESVTLTPQGLKHAATLAPVSEPPLFSDI